MVKVKDLLIFSPILILVMLIPFNLLIHKILVPQTPLMENQGVLISLSIIIIGLLCGFTGAFISKKMKWYTKTLTIILYVPAMLFSLLLSGL